MKKLGLFVLVFVVLSCAPAASVHADDLSSTDSIKDTIKDTISVTGHAKVSAEPDQAQVTVSVSALSKDVELAKNEADQKYQAVLSALKKHDVADNDIQLSNLNITPEYQWLDNTQVLQGMQVSRRLQITVTNLDKLGALLQSLIENQVSTVDHIDTQIKDRAALERQALTAAIVDAKEKARFLAAQFDKRLGTAHTIREYNASQPFRPQAEGMARSFDSAAMALPKEHFGTITVNAQVSVVFHAH